MFTSLPELTGLRCTQNCGLVIHKAWLTERRTFGIFLLLYTLPGSSPSITQGLCVCVCVGKRERARERGECAWEKRARYAATQKEAWRIRWVTVHYWWWFLCVNVCSLVISVWWCLQNGKKKICWNIWQYVQCYLGICAVFISWNPMFVQQSYCLFRNSPCQWHYFGNGC